MVKTRSGLTTQPSKKESGLSTKQKKETWRYPRCKRHPRGGVMCASCARAGFTKEGYEQHFKQNKGRHALPRPAVRTGAPPTRKN